MQTEFHRSQEIVLESFHASPTTDYERLLHNLCPVRAIKTYIQRTKDVRKCRHLLVSYKKGSQGFRISKKRISAWIVEFIQLCYQQQGLEPPNYKSLKAHGTGAQASSWAVAGVDPLRICKSAVWTNLHTFGNHYRLHLMYADQGFSTAVLSAAATDVL